MDSFESVLGIYWLEFRRVGYKRVSYFGNNYLALLRTEEGGPI